MKQTRLYICQSLGDLVTCPLRDGQWMKKDLCSTFRTASQLSPTGPSALFIILCPVFFAHYWLSPCDYWRNKCREWAGDEKVPPRITVLEVKSLMRFQSNKDCRDAVKTWCYKHILVSKIDWPVFFFFFFWRNLTEFIWQNIHED